jgi:hypothetical protein
MREVNRPVLVCSARGRLRLRIPITQKETKTLRRAGHPM